VIRALVSLVFLVGAGLSVYNVYGDGSGAQKLAEAKACGATGCIKLLRAERTPIGQSFTFQTGMSPPKTRRVKCDRAYVLVGDFDCAVTAESTTLN
jgi:hypothetical protein